MSRQADFWRGFGVGGGLVAVVAAVVLAVALPGSGGDPASASSPTAAATATATAEPSEAPRVSAHDIARSDPDDPLAIGDVDAPVLMIEWADLRCHYCGVFARETLPALLEEYVADGVLRIEWHSAPVLGGTSQDAAVAARAAGEQGRFWEFVEALYATEPTGRTEWTRDALTDVAAQIPGLDTDRFATDLDDPAVTRAAQDEASRSSSLGVSDTPFFLVEDQVLSGAQPLDTFRELIEAAAG